LTKRREDLVAARTQTINRLHRLLMDLVPGGARRNLTAKRAAALLAVVTPAGQAAVTRHQLAGELIADVHHLEQRIACVEARIKAAVAQANTSLLELFGGGCPSHRGTSVAARRGDQAASSLAGVTVVMVASSAARSAGRYR
jgi:transposase